MPELRKAPAEPRWDLYALAQVRADEVNRECRSRCRDCPGPVDERGCHTREVRQGFMGHFDWPMCQLGMINEPVWQDVVAVWRAGRFSALAGWGEDYTAGAEEAVAELELALARERDERARAAAKQARGDGSPVSRGGMRR